MERHLRVVRARLQEQVAAGLGRVELVAGESDQIDQRRRAPMREAKPVDTVLDEQARTVPNVVFPTAVEEIEGVHYVFYDMAVSKIDVAILERQ